MPPEIDSRTDNISLQPMQCFTVLLLPGIYLCQVATRSACDIRALEATTTTVAISVVDNMFCVGIASDPRFYLIEDETIVRSILRLRSSSTGGLALLFLLCFMGEQLVESDCERSVCTYVVRVVRTCTSRTISKKANVVKKTNAYTN